MKRINLLGQDNISQINQVFTNRSQTILFHSTSWSEIELAYDLLIKKIEAEKSELYIVRPDDKNKIKIDEVRQLLTQTIVSPRSRRYFLIFAADTMQAGAQNALLKELEEPSKNHFFFLFSNQINLLLPTIRSRCQKISLVNIKVSDIKNYFVEKYPQVTKQQLSQVAFIANRSIERWQTLLDNSKEFDRSSQLASLAKQTISASLYQRLRIINQIATTREQAIEFVELVLRIQSHLINKQANPTIVANTDKWLKSLELLQRNSSLKLGLLAAVI
ncbi:MAG: hypothetical protein ACOX0Z_03135 [Candidatus Nanosyncoccaceae bacterium]|jgi:DNA polymerase III gamma/tau subunit